MGGAMDRHSLSHVQTRAVRTVMQLFVEEDLAHGVARSTRRSCERCRRNRPAPGFIHYDEADLCNACATAYELARLRHATASVSAFVGAGQPR